MLRTHGNASQLHLFDPFLPDELKGLPAELATIDVFLDDEAFFAPYRQHFDPAWGRPSIPLETYLRIMYLKFSRSLGYETLVKEVADSITWRRFCRIGLADPVPHSTTLVKITRRVGPGVVEELNRALTDKARRSKLIRARSLRVDTTVVEADVSHPTDAGLLARSVGAMGRAVRRVKAAGGAPRTAFRDRRRAAGKRMRAMTAPLRLRQGHGREEVECITGELAALARRTRAAATKVLSNASRRLRRTPSNGKLRRAVADLGELIAGTERILAQTALRLAGQTTISDRMVSLADPDARPIRRGKLSAPVEFGYKLTVADGREGFIEAYSVVRGNPIDHQLMAPVIEAYVAETGRAPVAVAADRGFGLESVERMLKDKGVRTVAIPRKGRPAAERRQAERRPYFRRLVRWRTGCEGRISHFKRRFGGRRARFRRLRGARTWVWFGVLAHNLAKVGAIG